MASTSATRGLSARHGHGRRPVRDRAAWLGGGYLRLAARDCLFCSDHAAGDGMCLAHRRRSSGLPTARRELGRDAAGKPWLAGDAGDVDVDPASLFATREHPRLDADDLADRAGAGRLARWCGGCLLVQPGRASDGHEPGLNGDRKKHRPGRIRNLPTRSCPGLFRSRSAHGRA